MISKINPFGILQAHFLTLSSNKTGKLSSGDIGLFYIVPILLAVPLSICFNPSESLSNVLVTSLSIFAALLFNLLLLVLDGIKKTKEEIKKEEKSGSNESIKAHSRTLVVMKHTYNNIAYSILVSLITVSILLIPYLYKLEFGSRLQQVVWTVIYSLVINFILTMYMILKRMHIILGRTMDD